MATVSQDEFMCPVCLELLKDPVTVSCGHSFCKVCINGCWDREDQWEVYSCPQCRETFTPRPVLRRNNMLAEVVEKLKKTEVQAASAADCYAGAADVECDFCTGTKLKAVKSCLVCLASYCETHIKPHYQSPAFKKHQLVEASTNLQEKICSQHEEVIKIYCRTDQRFICSLCLLYEHKGHDTVAAVTERKKKQSELKELQTGCEQRLQEKQKKLEEVKQAVNTIKHSAQAAVEDSERIFTEMISQLEKKRSEAKKLIRDQEKVELSRAEGALEQLEQEIADLKRRDAELQQLSHTEDHIHFLQSFQSLCVSSGSQHSSSISVHQRPSFDGVIRSLSALKERLEQFCREEFNKLPAHAAAAQIISPEQSTCRADFLLSLDTLKELKKATLSSKDQKLTAIVDFLVEEKTAENKMHHQAAKVRNSEMKAHSKSSEEDEAGMDVDAVKNVPNEAGMSESTSADSVTLPEHLYWYLNNAYHKEINQIEKDCGVTINSKVAVSFTAKDTTKPDSVFTAKQRFSELVQGNPIHPEFVTIPHAHLNPEILQQLQFYVTTEKAKLVFKMSKDNCQLIGPRAYVSVAMKEMNLESDGMSSEMETDIKDASKSISRPLEMDFREAQTQLEMHEAHWNLLTIACEEQISRIQQKYGVNIDGKSSGATTTVTATSLKNQHVNLEHHAIREFIHLYQKVATSVVTCSLKNADDKDNVKKVLEKQNELWQQGKGAASRANQSYMKSLEHDSFGLNRKPIKGEKTNGKENEGGNEEDDKCPICLDKFTEKQKLKCGHEFCKDCLAGSVKSLGKSCPVCKDVFGTLIGNQPDGKMKCHFQKYSLPGFPHCGMIVIDYSISDGIQTAAHPNPGKWFSGTQRRAYLPDNKEGREVLELLKRAFDQKLIFTVGTSTTTGQKNAVTWNDIHHKTRTDGGPQNCGYPDADYLKRVKDELKAKGIK